jgi:transcriptional regulator with XRE-family HTH domain
VLIRQRRLERDLSLREAARRASAYARVSEGTWRRYEAPGDVGRDPVKIAAIAAVLSISPDDLTAAERPDAAAELEALMSRVAASPPVAGGFAIASGDGWAALMGEILAGFADINAGQMPEETKASLRRELIAGITRDATERRRQMRAVRDITTGTGA